MIHAAHSGAAYLNVGQSCSGASGHNMCSENGPVLFHNVQFSTFPISSNFLCLQQPDPYSLASSSAPKMIPLWQALIKMGWHQPQSPIQTDNTMALGITNRTINAKKMKSMEMCFWCKSQGQSHCYWGPSPTSLADFSTKAHPDIYHERQNPTHAG